MEKATEIVTLVTMSIFLVISIYMLISMIIQAKRHKRIDREIDQARAEAQEAHRRLMAAVEEADRAEAEEAAAKAKKTSTKSTKPTKLTAGRVMKSSIGITLQPGEGIEIPVVKGKLGRPKRIK